MAKKRKLQELLRRRKVAQIVEQVPNLPRNKAEEYLKSFDNDVDKALAKARDDGKGSASSVHTPKTAVTNSSDESHKHDAAGAPAASDVPTTSDATVISEAPAATIEPVSDSNAEPTETKGQGLEISTGPLDEATFESTNLPNGIHEHQALEAPESPKVAATDFLQYDQLPKLAPPDEPPKPGTELILEELIGAIQNGYPAAHLRDYLSYYHRTDETVLKEKLNGEVGGFPAIFFVVETNNSELIRYWIKYGGDPNTTYGPLRFPLLAFAILNGASSRLEATRTTETLLRLGASPLAIPVAYYDPFNRDLPSSGPDDQELVKDINDENKLWCTVEVRPLLAAALNLTQRYRLWQASKLKPSSGRERTLAFRKDAEEILGLQHTIIGQRLAVWSLRKSFIIQLAMPGRKPLVLLFAGPKGHGKNELANRLAHLLSLDIEMVDCTSFNSEDELLGSKSSEPSKGTQLNNFLARNAGERSIVMLDEFEKTDRKIHDALLIPFDQGEYTDRRNGQNLDCSQTIWVLATSKFDQIISEFCELNREILSASDLGPELLDLHRQLCRRLRRECIENFGAPLTSRISEVIPFLTFNEDEQAVLADRCIMELEIALASPVVNSTNPDEEKLVGNVQMRILDNAAVCSTIAKDYYLPEVGVRSITGGVDNAITNPLISQYLEDGEDFTEDQPETKFEVGTNQDNEVEVSLITASAQ